MDREAERRIGRNESLFREVNEAIARGLWPGEDERIRFRCECALLDCNVAVLLLPGEYRGIRADGRRFVVAPGHEVPEVEDVVDRHSDYTVVRKRDEAGEVAAALDPRA